MGDEAAGLADDGPAVGEGVGGKINGVAGWGRGGFSFIGGAGEVKSRDVCAGLLSAPNELTSTLSASFTVPSERKACSKSMSVRDIRRLELLDATGCKPPGKAVGGTGNGRGVAAFRNRATVGEGGGGRGRWADRVTAKSLGWHRVASSILRQVGHNQVITTHKLTAKLRLKNIE